MKISHFNIYSKSPETLAHFLTSVFDIPSSREENGSLKFKIGDAKFIIHLVADVELFSRPLFEITLDSMDDVRKIRDKIEFYKYTSQNPRVQVNEDEDSIQVIDPDGQGWLIASETIDNVSNISSKYGDEVTTLKM